MEWIIALLVNWFIVWMMVGFAVYGLGCIWWEWFTSRRQGELLQEVHKTLSQSQCRTTRFVILRLPSQFVLPEECLEAVVGEFSAQTSVSSTETAQSSELDQARQSTQTLTMQPIEGQGEKCCDREPDY